MQYAGINGGCETFRVRGEGAFTGNKSKQEYGLGAEGAGTVAAVGPGVNSLSVGQAVACNSASAFSEYGVTPAHMCTPLQQATPEAVALTLSAVTAAASLDHTAKVQPGEVVLVTAAAGGTGHFAVQLAQLTGARVIAVAGSEAKKQKLQSLGLERVINYKEEVGLVVCGYQASLFCCMGILSHSCGVAGSCCGFISEAPSWQHRQPSCTGADISKWRLWVEFEGVGLIDDQQTAVTRDRFSLDWPDQLRFEVLPHPLRCWYRHMKLFVSEPSFASYNFCCMAATMLSGHRLMHCGRCLPCPAVQDVGGVLAKEYPQGVDVVYEGVGGALRASIMEHLAPSARVLQVSCCDADPRK